MHRFSFSISVLAALLVAVCLATVAVADPPKGFVSLFDGETLNGWDGKEGFWSVRDGAITGQTTADNPTKGNTFLIWQDGELGDFELHAKFKIDGGNSGIQYRSEHRGDFVVAGYQADIDDAFKFVGILYEEKGRGILVGRTQKVVVGADGKKEVVGSTGDEKDLLKAVKKGEWNDYVITAKGNHLTQSINGVTTIDLVDNEEAKRKLKGILALQLHAGPPMVVQFKEIYLKQ